MFEQPDLTAYYEHIANYDRFLAFVLFSATIGGYFVLKYGKPSRIKLPEWLQLPAILLLALGLRLPVMSQSFWYDEAFTSTLVSGSWSDLMTAVAGDVHPPGYYALVKLFTSVFGQSELVMRLPALLSSLGLVVVMYLITKEYGDRVARWSALLTAVLPTSVYYGAEARYPAFMALMLALSYLGIQKKRGLLMSAPLAVASYAHVNSYFYIVIMLGVWLLQGGRKRDALLPAGAMASWLPVALQQAGDVSDGFWLTQYLPIRHIVEMTIGARFAGADTAILPMLATMTVLVVAVWKWRKRASWLWLAVVAGVPASQWITGALWHPVYLPRTLLFSSLLLVVPVAWWLDKSSFKPLAMVGGLGLIVAVAVLPFSDRSSYSDDIIAECGESPIIYATNTHTAILASHHSSAEVWLYEDGNSTAQQLPREAQEALFDNVTNLLREPIEDVCIVAQVSPFNSSTEMTHLTLLSFIYPEQIRLTEGTLGYYVMLEGLQ